VVRVRRRQRLHAPQWGHVCDSARRDAGRCDAHHQPPDALRASLAHRQRHEPHVFALW
jgi:hypothetical protein